MTRAMLHQCSQALGASLGTNKGGGLRLGFGMFDALTQPGVVGLEFTILFIEFAIFLGQFAVFFKQRLALGAQCLKLRLELTAAFDGAAKLRLELTLTFSGGGQFGVQLSAQPLSFGRQPFALLHQALALVGHTLVLAGQLPLAPTPLTQSVQ